MKNNFTKLTALLILLFANQIGFACDQEHATWKVKHDNGDGTYTVQIEIGVELGDSQQGDPDEYHIEFVSGVTAINSFSPATVNIDNSPNFADDIFTGSIAGLTVEYNLTQDPCGAGGACNDANDYTVLYTFVVTGNPTEIYVCTNWDDDGLFGAGCSSNSACGHDLTTFESTMLILPVELTQFEAIQTEECGIDLQWATASEINNSHFEVQRSEDGRNFFTIGSVDGAGYAYKAQTYSFMDYSPMSVGYYRLMQVDYDGEVWYSEVQTVRLNCGDLFNTVTISPNPVVDNLTIQIDSKEANPATDYQIIDVAGKVILNGKIDLNKGFNQQTIDGKNLDSGIYFVQFTAKEEPISSIKFIKI